MENALKMKRLLDFFGTPFVYRSPDKQKGFLNFLWKVPNRHLKVLAGTNSNYSKKRLIQMYLEKTTNESQDSPHPLP
tara:strand:+ start:1437 stop:1667 length:231 start_codon:yes stop_codon:yes gene_type:complete